MKSYFQGILGSSSRYLGWSRTDILDPWICSSALPGFQKPGLTLILGLLSSSTGRFTCKEFFLASFPPPPSPRIIFCLVLVVLIPLSRIQNTNKREKKPATTRSFEKNQRKIRSTTFLSNFLSQRYLNSWIFIVFSSCLLLAGSMSALCPTWPRSPVWQMLSGVCPAVAVQPWPDWIL